MMPPNCCICREDCFSSGRLIFFSETDEDKIELERLRQPGFVGHPPNAFWFCDKHYEKAAELQNNTKIIALPLIKEYYKL